MCGLIAGSGKIETRYLVSLGCQSQERGDQSAGVGWLDRGSVPNFIKIAQSPLVAFPVTLYRGIRQAVRARSPIIGHTRQATTGAVTSDNAHPFLDDGILFAHNGVIHNYEDFGKYEVDSQSLIHGIKLRDFTKYEGPIALVWIESGKLHAARKGNPLFRGNKKDAVYLASDETYLKAIGCTKIRELAESHIYSWDEARLDQPKAIPFSLHNSYQKPWKGGYVSSSERFESRGGYWDKDQQCWKKNDDTYDWNAHRKLQTELVPVKKEADTLAEIDEEEAYNMLGVEDLCLECKAKRRMIASDYCETCTRISFDSHSRGH